MSKIYRVEMLLDQEWLQAIQKITNDVYEGETCRYVKIEEITDSDVPTVS